MICKQCGEDKTKEPVIRSNGVRFIDDRGRLWNGKQCADCYRVYNRERMRLKRLQEKSQDQKFEIQET